MSDYPSIAYTDASVREIEDGRIVERTDGGGARARSLWGAVKTSWTLEHVVDATDLATILDHHAAHLGVSFSFVDHASTSRTMIYGSGGLTVTHLGGGMHRVSVELLEV